MPSAWYQIYELKCNTSFQNTKMLRNALFSYKLHYFWKKKIFFSRGGAVCTPRLVHLCDQSRTNAPNAEIELSVAFESDRCESIEQFAANPLSGEIPPCIIQVECQEPQHPIQFRLHQDESEIKVARHLATSVQNSQVVLPIEDHLRTFSQTHETEMS